jgi:lipooligosaccharide transport system permease protein
VFTLPVVVLLGLAFTVPTAAYAATQNSDGAFVPYNRFIIVPMFLFSGTFFPVTRLPLPLEWLAYATPLWHGVNLCRELTLGNVDMLGAVGHVAYLLVLVVAGYAWGLRTYTRRLFN